MSSIQHSHFGLSVPRWRWALLMLGLSCAMISLPLPGSYYAGNALWSARVDRTWLTAALVFLLTSFHPALFLAGWACIVGTLTVIASPLALLWRNQKFGRLVSSWLAPILPTVWVWPLLEMYKRSGDHFLYGYYLLSTGYTLVFVALMHWPDTRLRRRLRRGLCPACGYDLRGGSGPTCPECGALRPASIGSAA